MPSKPPIPAASQAKSKLSAFQLDHDASGDAASGEARQEGIAIEEHQKSKAGSNDKDNGSGSGSDGNPGTKGAFSISDTSHIHTFPCTPGARLPLEDLIGNCDLLRKDETTNESPDEQVGWVPGNLTTPNPRKRKHRAKSSSPIAPNSSSQPDAKPAFFARKDLLSTSNKTPTTDPAADLWQRYGTGKQTGDTLKLPELNNLIFQGSPRPMETPMKSGPLRRWASTGNDWPSSKNKRRCTNSRTSVNVWQDQVAQDSGGKSKVATMVQKIQESLASQRLEQENSARVQSKTVVTDAPSSSSPLPETGANNFPTPTVVSPLRARQPNVKSPAKAAATLSQESVPEIDSRKSNFQATQSGGFRTESLNPYGVGPLHLQCKAPLPAYKRPSIIRPPSQPKIQQIAPVLPVAIELDEFGDDAFDLTADDLDELLSQNPLEKRSLYDIPAYPTAAVPQQPKVAENNSRNRPPPQIITIDDDDDEFGGNDIDDNSFAEAEFSATQAFRTSPRKSKSKKKDRSPQKSHAVSTQSTGRSQHSGGNPRLQRFVVKQVVKGEYTNDHGRCCEEQVLLATNERTAATTAITLRGSWTHASVAPRDIVHIAYVPHFHDNTTTLATPPGQIMVTDDEWSPFLIVHPDHMLSATTVADSFDCIRKAVLQDRIKATGESSKAMVYGKILHEIFQQALSANQWNDNFLSEIVERTIQAHVEGLWELGMSDTNLAAEEIKAKMGELAAWANVFVAENPSDTSLVDDRQGEKVWMSVSKLIAIEEHVWSPQFGLKGNVDATIQTTLIDDPNAAPKKLIVPFEVKTGRTTQSPVHRAQTALYTLLLSDRYDVAVEAGILYYLESSSMSRISPPLMEVRQMVQQRNRLASYIFKARHPPHATSGIDVPIVDAHPPESQEIEESGLPSLLKNPFKCGRCYAQASCFTYHALVEGGTADSAGMIDDHKKNHSLIWKEAVGHLLGSTKQSALSGALKKWFIKWDRLLAFEEGDQSRLRKELWTMSSTEREALGRCFGSLLLTRDLTDIAISVTTQVIDGIEGSGGKINRYAYVFQRAHASPGGNFTEGSQLTIGEPVVVSSEQGQWALANGYIVAIAKREITVAVDRKLGHSRDRLPDFDDKRNQAFRGVMTVGKEDHNPQPSDTPPLLYRLDKDEFSNGLALIRNNLVTLMSTHPIHTKLREQIIMGAEPTFAPASPSASSRLQPTQLGEMNDDQQTAVNKVLSARDYALILGMPGTGKTTTIAHIIRALLAENKSILLTSFTHTAVDNILLKIRSVAPPGSILRLGVPAKINNQVQQFCQLAATPRKTIGEIEEAYMETKIVATTCMGTNHSIFQRRTFDVCIVDEASQITLPTILGPLLKARRFVLVGDHFQLPPLVQNKAALEGGLDVSLFRQLSEEQPDAVAALGRQYRMCEEIMALSNELIYNGQLRCGNAAVANRTLQIPNDPTTALAQFHRPLSSSSSPHTACPSDQTCWLAHATNPQTKVLFANTDPLGPAALETLTTGKNITNALEARLATQLVQAFLALGIPPTDIGVITLYRSQLALLRQLFRQSRIPGDVEIDSADRFQGRDKECIVLSMVRSNESGTVGELLRDWRRVNVALTRARSKLVVLGSRRTLVGGNEVLGGLVGLVEGRGWGVDLPQDADRGHGVGVGTQEEGRERAGEEVKVKRRSPLKVTQSNVDTGKAGPRRILGKGSRLAEKMRVAREQVAIEIFEEVTGEEF